MNFANIIKKFVPDLMTPEDVEKEVAARMAQLPIIASAEDPMMKEFEGGFRRVSGFGDNDPMRRDYPYVNHQLMAEVAHAMYVKSGLTKRFIEDTANFVLGSGIEYQVFNDDDGEAKKILDEFWNDSRNNFDINLNSRVQALGLLGEQCWPVSVMHGRTWVSYIDPALIQDVETMLFFPEVAMSVKVSGNRNKVNSLQVIREDTNYYSKMKGRLVAEPGRKKGTFEGCFYFSVNKMPNQPRGYSDLVSKFDFIDNYEKGLMGEFDRARMLNSFIWDVTLINATPGQITQAKKDWGSPPPPGTVRIHNDKVIWKAESPSLNAADKKTFFDLCRTYLAATMNVPESWLGSGGKAYQTEAEQIVQPSFKNLLKRQQYVKYMLEHVLKFVLDQAIIAGRIKEDEEKPFKISVIMPEMSVKDQGKTVATLNQLAHRLYQ